MSDTPLTTETDPRQAFLEAEQSRWLTVDEAAQVLRTNRHTILRAVHEQHLALLAFGKVWRIHVDSLVQGQKVLHEWQPTQPTTLSRRSHN